MTHTLKFISVTAVATLAFWCGMRTQPRQAVNPPRPTAVEPQAEPQNSFTLDDLFDVIRTVETGGHPTPNTAVGDGGLSYGPFQIGKLYFQDSQEFDPSLAGVRYEQVGVDSVARRVMIAYWGRYAKSFTAEELCRLHNGGPSKRGTDKYWAKCRDLIER